MTIAIFGSPYPEHFSKYIQHLIKKLETEHINLIIEEEFSIFQKTTSVLTKALVLLIITKHLKIKLIFY